MSPAADLQDLSFERHVVGLCVRHVIVLLGAAYVLQALDRLNVAYAALRMNIDLGLSTTVFGVGAGLFFVTYFLFGVPSNLGLVRFGARRWLALIMTIWGAASVAMAFVYDARSFYIARLVLGAAEAGFAPALFYCVGVWLPANYRARTIAALASITPAVAVLGGPFSGLLLKIEAFGLQGWQWLFIVEGLPTVLLAGLIYLLLRDSPQEAEWLTDAEKAWLTTRLAADAPSEEATRDGFHWVLLLSPNVLALGVTLFGAASVGFSVMFFLPQITKDFGLTDMQALLTAAIPPAVGVAFMWYWGRRSDARGERVGHAIAGLAIAIAGLLLAALSASPYGRLTGLCITLAGAYGFQPSFWTLPGTFLTGASAAAGIAMVHSVGNVAGFVGPSIMGLAKDATGSFDSGLLIAAAMAIIGVMALLAFQRNVTRARLANAHKH